MTKSKFISDYTERLGFYMLEGYSDTVAVEKMLGEVYDKVKRPTRKKYSDFCVKEINSTFTYKEHQKSLRQGMAIMAEIIYKKYLSDSNGGDSADTVSEEKSLGTYRGKDMRSDTEEGRQAIRDCISNQEATIKHLQKNNLSL